MYRRLDDGFRNENLDQEIVMYNENEASEKILQRDILWPNV